MILSPLLLTTVPSLLILSSTAECPRHQPDVYMNDPVEIEGPLQTMTAPELQRVRQQQYGAPLFGKEVVMGFTQARIQAGHTVDYGYEQIGDSDEYCVVIRSVTFEFPLGLTVFLSPDYSESSCEYKATYDHEQQHVDATRQIFDDYRARIPDRLTAVLEGMTSQPMPHGSIDAYEAQVDEAVIDAIKPIVIEMDREMAARNRGFDTKKEYRRLTKLCQ